MDRSDASCLNASSRRLHVALIEKTMGKITAVLTMSPLAIVRQNMWRHVTPQEYMNGRKDPMRRLGIMVAAAALASPITGCGDGRSVTEQITDNLTESGWSYETPPDPNTLARQWFGPGWANRDVSRDGGATWCRASYDWSVTNATDVYTFTILYVHADDACGFVEGTDERFRFHMDPDADGWATTGRFLPGEPADSAFGDLILSANLCATSSDAYARDCEEPNGDPVAPTP